MFELPEVETVRRDLDRELVGKKVKTVEAMSMKVLGRYKNRKAFTSQLDGTKITGVTRRGLYLAIELDAEHVLQDPVDVPLALEGRHLGLHGVPEGRDRYPVLVHQAEVGERDHDADGP